MNNGIDLNEVHRRYRRELTESVVPFWLDNAVDHEFGGLFTCIRDDGTLISTDKYMWSQLRALWTFSALSSLPELHDRRMELLDVADGLFRFVSGNGRDENGHWVFALTREGAPHTGATSIYADGFALLGLTEYARATGSEAALALAQQTFTETVRRLNIPGSYESAPYPIPQGMKSHGISMIFSFAFFELGLLTGSEEVLAQAHHHAEQVMTSFLRPERRLLLEFMNLDDTESDGGRGRAIVPGHAIESMWFMIHIYSWFGERGRIAEAAEAIRWHMELGWDDEYGGILHAVDAEGREPWWPFADAKLWWPQTEALYALLLVREETGVDWALDWFRKVDEYAFRHYPVREHGEWTQRLDRFGRPFTETVALPVKDPFHLPRALIYSISSLERLTRSGKQPT